MLTISKTGTKTGVFYQRTDTEFILTLNLTQAEATLGNWKIILALKFKTSKKQKPKKQGVLWAHPFMSHGTLKLSMKKPAILSLNWDSQVQRNILLRRNITTYRLSET